ncbi:MAG: OmpA family protein, partial [Pseudomonadota bacterium]|nr:OmpA family protein [Pseudomonadota bacterium]
MIFRIGAVILAMAALSACSSAISDKAAGLKPVDDKFLAALQAEYVALMNAENDEKDFNDADHFALKAIDAAGGKPVKPDAYNSRKLPSGTAAALKAAEKRIKKAIKGGADIYAPGQMAKAQAMYDCWLQEQEENHQPDHIRACRLAYLDAMDAVDEAKPVKKAAAKPKKKVFLGPFYIYFPFNEDNPEDPFNEEIFSLIISTAKKAGDKKLHIVGHTDRAGSSEYNMDLSERRAINVSLVLTERGMKAKSMKYSFQGEDNPATPTKDG